MAFNQGFSDDLQYKALVIVEGRRYLVGGTFDEFLPSSNTAVDSISPRSGWKGDLVILFFDRYKAERFLEGLPRYTNAAEKRRILRKVVRGWVKFGFC